MQTRVEFVRFYPLLLEEDKNSILVFGKEYMDRRLTLLKVTLPTCSRAVEIAEEQEDFTSTASSEKSAENSREARLKMEWTMEKTECYVK